MELEITLHPTRHKVNQRNQLRPFFGDHLRPAESEGSTGVTFEGHWTGLIGPIRGYILGAFCPMEAS